jgi:nucleoside-diphosphate-sugar epimerase
MHIDIIGGSGFIGSRLARRLSQLHNVNFSVIDKVSSINYNKQSIYADVRSISDLRNAISNEAIIINLAAEHKDDVYPLSLYHEVNVEGAKNICTAANEKGIKKIIFTSSVAVYGFPPPGIDETGLINPFNEYGKTKWFAEQIYCKWQAEEPEVRSLVIVRPTVVFGEGNRGNFYNLLNQIFTSKFVMIGDGLNRKSIAYVENVAAFLQFSLNSKPGVHIFNYIDKPDFTMNTLVGSIKKSFNRTPEIKFRIPYRIALLIGYIFDFISKITLRKFHISAIRIKKFCSNSVYESCIYSTNFVPPFSLMDAIKRTIDFEFFECKKNSSLNDSG